MSAPKTRCTEEGPHPQASSKLLMPQEEVQGGPATQLLDLADGVLGVLWRKLDRASRIALRRTCRAMRDSPAINAQIDSLAMQMDGKTAQQLLQDLCAFPRSPAQLRHLRLQGSGNHAWPLLRAAMDNEAALPKFAGLESLSFKTCGNLQWRELCGALAPLCPALRSLRFTHNARPANILLPSSPPTPFTLPLGGLTSLQNLDLRLEMWGAELQQAVDTVATTLPGLQSLGVMGMAQGGGGAAMHGRLDVSPLAQLPGLQHLTVDVDSVALAGLAAVAQRCTRLSSLALSLRHGLDMGVGTDSQAGQGGGGDGGTGSSGASGSGSGPGAWWPSLEAVVLRTGSCEPGRVAALGLQHAPRLKKVVGAQDVLLQKGSTPQGLCALCQLLAKDGLFRGGELRLKDCGEGVGRLGLFLPALAPLGARVQQLTLQLAFSDMSLGPGDFEVLSKALPCLTKLALTLERYDHVPHPDLDARLPMGVLTEAVEHLPHLTSLTASHRPCSPMEVVVAAAFAQQQAIAGKRAGQLVMGLGTGWRKGEAREAKSLVGRLLGGGVMGPPAVRLDFSAQERWEANRGWEDGSIEEGDDEVVEL